MLAPTEPDDLMPPQSSVARALEEKIADAIKLRDEAQTKLDKIQAKAATKTRGGGKVAIQSAKKSLENAENVLKELIAQRPAEGDGNSATDQVPDIGTLNLENSKDLATEPDNSQSEQPKAKAADTGRKRKRKESVAEPTVDLDKLAESGRKQIQEYLRTKDIDLVTDDVALAVRRHQGFLPEAAITTRELALRCLKTNRKNKCCIYHLMTKTDKKRDNAPDGKFKVTGVEGDQIMKKKHRADRDLKPADGDLNCGCSEDLALIDLYFWKTWTAENQKGDVEGLLTDCLNPRTRIFVAQFFTQTTRLTINDLYTNGSTPAIAKRHRIQLQIRRLEEELASLGPTDNTPARQSGPSAVASTSAAEVQHVEPASESSDLESEA